MKYQLTFLFVFMAATAMPVFAEPGEEKDKRITSQIAIDDEYPIVVVDNVPYGLFGLPKSGTGRPEFYFQVSEETRRSLFWVYRVDLKDTKLRFYWLVPSSDNNAPLINSISVSVSKNAGQENATLDPKVNASEFIQRTEKTMIERDEFSESYCRYEYCVDKQPTGKFLAFDETESTVASIDKSFKPRKMTLSSKDKAALFVRVNNFYKSGK